MNDDPSARPTESAGPTDPLPAAQEVDALRAILGPEGGDPAGDPPTPPPTAPGGLEGGAPPVHPDAG